jgi:DnaJ-class molecular chaperone
LIEEHTLYDILGVEPNDPLEKIRAIYRLRTREAHPDRGGGNGQLQMLLNEAYEILSDPEKRRKYNERMGLSLKPRPIKPGKPTYQEILVTPQNAGQPIPYRFKRWEPCSRCWGQGCTYCRGKGKTLETVTLTVTIPVGVAQILVENQGAKTEPGGTQGDLILYVVWVSD